MYIERIVQTTNLGESGYILLEKSGGLYRCSDGKNSGTNFKIWKWKATTEHMVPGWEVPEYIDIAL